VLFVTDHQVPNGWNQVENHEKYLKEFEEAIQVVAKYGFPNIITLAATAEECLMKGLENCVKGLKKLAPMPKIQSHCYYGAPQQPGPQRYMCDHSSWVLKCANNRFRAC
jgi:hypothetical protein